MIVRWFQLVQRNRELLALLERERAAHLQHLLEVVAITGVHALHIANVGSRVYPENLEIWRDIAREQGARLLIVSGGSVLGVYGVEP